MSIALDPGHIMQVGIGFWASKTLLSAVEIGVFTELAKHPEDLKTIQGRLGLHPRSAGDFMDALVAMGFLRRIDGVYHNTPETDFFLDKHKPSYMGGMLEMANHRLYRYWGNLTEGLRTGKPQNETREGGTPVFEALYADPARLREFLAAMTGLSRGSAIAIGQSLQWSDYSSFADIGCAQGDVAVQIARLQPHLRGTGFDLPEVAPIFEDYVEENGLADRVTFAPGSFFTDDLPKADVITMGHILHDWDLETKRMLIRKAYEALPSGGSFVAFDAMIDNDRSRHTMGLLMSLNMLIETPGGFDYTSGDCQGWMREAGFRSTRVEHLAGPDWMVVGVK
ncbi:MAG: methyltransferase [Bryobacterales bacterium]|nr:methyltransferase [Bryobacterales bacterium]